ncbi:MAG: 3-phosphoshikimate 1-carboxyvinyltransferase [Alphaproteobacteria bacterium]|nr:3-phosphoshikimate 1-carboxyvinyltransferase [Alphaproteobacteria bacterium]
MDKKPLTAHRQTQPLKGHIRLPGDKSQSHRALMLAALAHGTTHIHGLLQGADVLATAQALKSCGVSITYEDENKCWMVIGQGTSGLSAPQQDLDFGNAGTGVRLMMGLLSGVGVAARFTGDISLSARPMQRITDPLAQMGVMIESSHKEITLPLRLTPPPQLLPLDYTPPQASAQVKAAILLAGLGAAGTTIIREAHPTRDHSENMLRLFGAAIETRIEEEHHIITLQGHPQLIAPFPTHADPLQIAGDPSSAAFAMVAALLVPHSDIVLENMMLNPHRDGLMRILQKMGATIDITNPRQQAGERVGDIRVRHSPLHGITIGADAVAAMIDEYPALAIAAAHAQGETYMQGLAELRVKESDRLAAIIAGLNANGVATQSNHKDDLRIFGAPEKNNIKGGAMVATHHDHRIAMAFLVLGLVAQNPVQIDDATMIATSYPDFTSDMAKLGVRFV